MKFARDSPTMIYLLERSQGGIYNNQQQMSVCDPYREFELYLEQAHHEICQVFEPRNSLPLYRFTKDKLTKEAAAEQPGGDDNTNLNHMPPNMRHTMLCSSATASCKLDSDVSITSNVIKKQLVKHRSHRNMLDHIPELTRSHSEGFLQVDHIMATKRSPLPFTTHNSTNLTSWLDYSSSPCLIRSDDTSTEADGISLISFTGNIQKQILFWQQELSIKSSSAPVLKKVVLRVNKQARRSQSDRHLSEIEATEACKWLRAAGFPQYAQMYDNQQFPVDVVAAEQDHPLLEASVLHSLFRRLHALNKCALVVHQQQRGGGSAHAATATLHSTDDDSEDEEQCALSDNWTYLSDLRRWSRNNVTKTPQERHPPLPASSTDLSSEDCCDEPCGMPATTPKGARSSDRLLRRVVSNKYKRRNRDGVVINMDSSSSCDETGEAVNYNVLDMLSRQLENLSSSTTSTDECYLKRHAPSPPTPYSDSGHTGIYAAGRPVASLSCTQLQVLRKLALLKLTAHMERHCPTHRSGWNWDLPKLIRQKMKSPAYRDKSVFGVPLTIILQRSASSMPRGIEEALQWLQQTAYDQVGLFRKSGVKSRIHNLKMMVEKQNGIRRQGSSDGYLNFSEHQAYDIADMVKQYFRELPEALLTNKLSETFILIFQYVPEAERRQAVLCALLLMPDEHCEVLQCLLHFLTGIAENAAVNQMTDSNLAVCFAPSLFHYNQMPAAASSATSCQQQNLAGGGNINHHPRELAENKAAQDCLLYLLRNCASIFTVTDDLLKQCTYNESSAVQLADLGGAGNWSVYLNECQNMLLREVREKGWVPVARVVGSSGGRAGGTVDLAYKKVADGHPLRLWKVNAEIEAPPTEVLFRILRERSKWDEDLHSARTVSQLRKCAEVFQFVRRRNIVSPWPLEDYCVVRSWTNADQRSVIVETSVEHPDAVAVPKSVRGIVLASRYLIEPCGSGRSRLVHMSRVDMRGRMPEWYHKNYGHICALHIANIQSSFRRAILAASGRESKV